MALRGRGKNGANFQNELIRKKLDTHLKHDFCAFFEDKKHGDCVESRLKVSWSDRGRLAVATGHLVVCHGGL